MYIEQQGPARVGGVGSVLPPSGEMPEQKAVNRSECQLSAFGTLTGTGHILQYPPDFGGRKIRIDQQSGFAMNPGFMTGTFE